MARTKDPPYEVVIEHCSRDALWAGSSSRRERFELAKHNLAKSRQDSKLITHKQVIAAVLESRGIVLHSSDLSEWLHEKSRQIDKPTVDAVSNVVDCDPAWLESGSMSIWPDTPEPQIISVDQEFPSASHARPRRVTCLDIDRSCHISPHTNASSSLTYFLVHNPDIVIDEYSKTLKAIDRMPHIIQPQWKTVLKFIWSIGYITGGNHHKPHDAKGHAVTYEIDELRSYSWWIDPISLRAAIKMAMQDTRLWRTESTVNGGARKDQTQILNCLRSCTKEHLNKVIRLRWATYMKGYMDSITPCPQARSTRR